MSTYVMSDLHGEYEMFLDMLEKIDFSSEDVLFIVGDIIDRGSKPITLLRKLLSMENVYLLYGNHEYYAKECLKLLGYEVTEETLENFKKEDYERLVNWTAVGANSTIQEFRNLSNGQRLDIIDGLENDFSMIEMIEVNNKKFILVHAGLNNYDSDKDIEDYTWQELLEMRCDYKEQISDRVKIVTGHTPTQLIEGNLNKGYIYHNGCHIAIDCGASYSGGRLGCLRLDDMKEYYVERNIQEALRSE